MVYETTNSDTYTYEQVARLYKAASCVGRVTTEGDESVIPARLAIPCELLSQHVK